VQKGVCVYDSAVADAVSRLQRLLDGFQEKQVRPVKLCTSNGYVSVSSEQEKALAFDNTSGKRRDSVTCAIVQTDIVLRQLIPGDVDFGHQTCCCCGGSGDGD
jgi:hypothetical protein